MIFDSLDDPFRTKWGSGSIELLEYRRNGLNVFNIEGHTKQKVRDALFWTSCVHAFTTALITALGTLPGMASSSHAFQSPRGMRDFPPPEMAQRRWIESIWRKASVDHGFDEIEGPTFEHVDLYTVKSGPGIVSELFSFERAGGDTTYALRPEFTPTLARMAAAKGKALSHPTRWFSIPCLFRAERPQRGRLREHVQWNVDVIGGSTPSVDADVIAVAVEGLRRMGVTPEHMQVRLSHRCIVLGVLAEAGVEGEAVAGVFDLLDKRDKMSAEIFAQKAAELGLPEAARDAIDRLASLHFAASDVDDLSKMMGTSPENVAPLAEMLLAIDAIGLTPWCTVDPGIVRGLAYYTGAVWEIHETKGKERAVAGGGRYDGLIELFGGPPTPACGFGMGDVVLGLVLEDLGLIEDPEALMPRPDVFVISTGDGETDAHVSPLVHALRAAGWHTRCTAKSTRNVGKLLKEAGRVRARYAVILDEELQRGVVIVKDLDSGDQQEVELGELEAYLAR